MTRIFLATAVVQAAVLVWAAQVLPDSVPMHWSGGLRPDDWGARADFVTAAGLTSVLVLALFAGLALLVRRLPLSVVEVPHADRWKDPRHVGALRRRLADDALWFGAATLLVLSAVTLLAVDAARSPQQRLSSWTPVVVGAYLAAMAGRCAWMATVRYRPPADGRR